MLPIPGTSSVEHLEENVAAASLRLTDEEFKKLFAVPAASGLALKSLRTMSYSG